MAFEDDFSNPKSGWQTGSDESKEAVYENGEFSLLNKKSRAGCMTYNAATGEQSDFSVEVDVRRLSEDPNHEGGIVFRSQDKEVSHYAFLINGQGQYLVVKRLQGIFTVLKGLTYSNYIKTGTETNRLKVVCQATQIEVWANGYKLATVTDRSLSSGKIGLEVDTAEIPGSHYLFDNFELQAIPTTPMLGLPGQTESPSGLPDLAWTGILTLEPLAPIVGEKLHVKQSWKNSGPAAATSEFDIKLEIRRENINVFEQYIRVPQPVKPQEGQTLDVPLEYMIPEPSSYQITLMLDSKAVIAESREDNNITQSNILEVPDLSKESSFSKGSDTASIAQAITDIEKYRKGDVTLTVVDPTGQPCSGLTVEYTQVKHSFLFGVFSSSQDERVWSLMREAGINYAPVVLSWKDTEPESGRFNLGPERISLLSKFGLFGMGHCLIFLTPDMSWSTPDYVIRWSFDEYKNAVYAHFHEVVNAYKHEIKIWNVFNEPMYRDANILGLTSKQTIEIIKEGIQAIRDTNPKARILINIFNAGGEIPGVYPYDFLKEVVQSNVDFDIIGLEFYYNAYIADGLNPHPRRTLTGMAELIDQYSTFGKKIIVTEMSVPSKSEDDMQGYWNQPWSEELQAEYLKAAYTIFFSKPQLEGITWWDATDTANPFIYHGALLNEQDKPKKSYYVLKNLIKSWTTTGKGLTDSNGHLDFRGFGGTYEVTITDNKTGLSKKHEIIVEEQKHNLATIVLD
jgi:GH35 family endo-1,4-beta-xylanase